MKHAKKCRKCGCTEASACVEFDANGRGWPCFWSNADTCSACMPAMPLRQETVLGIPPLVVAPQLAGMVARRRT